MKRNQTGPLADLLTVAPQVVLLANNSLPVDAATIAKITGFSNWCNMMGTAKPLGVPAADYTLMTWDGTDEELSEIYDHCQAVVILKA